MNKILSLIGRNEELFIEDIKNFENTLKKEVSQSKFLILGGAGSIGQAVSKEIFKRNPKKIHIVDISENNLVELVRDIRSSYGYIDGEFKTLALDIGSSEYDAFIKSDGAYDYVLNLSALKHVRSEKDEFTLMRMINVNIMNTIKTIDQSINSNVKKYFCVSTDKAANPVNMMGASKRIMEMFLSNRSKLINISTARFANVAFSDGSLLHGFNMRIQKSQPIVAPNDVKRYFVTPKESGELCLMSCIFGNNGDIFFPKLKESLHLISFADIAKKYLKNIGYLPYECESEDEARKFINFNAKTDLNEWPCFFSKSDTTGEKDFEEFFTDNEEIDFSNFKTIGVVKNNYTHDSEELENFIRFVTLARTSGKWKRKDLVDLFHKIIPSFNHKETGKYLDEKM